MKAVQSICPTAFLFIILVGKKQFICLKSIFKEKINYFEDFQFNT